GYFSANGIARGSAPMLWMRPKLELLRFVTGLPFTNQLNALNASTRASILCCAVSENCRTSERSTVCRPGPKYALRFELPYVPRAGCAKAFGLSQLLIVPSA